MEDRLRQILKDNGVGKNSEKTDKLVKELLVLFSVVRYGMESKQCEIMQGDEKVEDKPTPLDWLLREKLGIEKGTTYIEPKLTVRQCASYISEYVKKHCC